MQKWEYKRVYKQDGTDKYRGWPEYSPNAGAEHNNNIDFILDGFEGWEMFAVDDGFYYFKRQV